MNLKARHEGELEAMKGIMAMLCAFVDLADLALRAPYPVRSFMFWLLRRAELVAREWVDGPGGCLPLRGADAPADALDLAASFRRLACAVRELAAQYRHFSRRRYDAAQEADGPQSPAVARLHHEGTLRELVSRVSLAAAPCPDTS